MNVSSGSAGFQALDELGRSGMANLAQLTHPAKRSLISTPVFDQNAAGAPDMIEQPDCSVVAPSGYLAANTQTRQTQPSPQQMADWAPASAASRVRDGVGIRPATSGWKPDCPGMSSGSAIAAVPQAGDGGALHLAILVEGYASFPAVKSRARATNAWKAAEELRRL